MYKKHVLYKLVKILTYFFLKAYLRTPFKDSITVKNRKMITKHVLLIKNLWLSKNNIIRVKHVLFI